MILERMGLIAFGIIEAIIERRKSFMLGSAAIVLALFAVYFAGALGPEGEYEPGHGEYHEEEPGGNENDPGADDEQETENEPGTDEETDENDGQVYDGQDEDFNYNYNDDENLNDNDAQDENAPG